MRKTTRYQLPKKSIKGDCPDCSPKNRKTLSRYIDIRTGDLLPGQFGICDRVNNCGYHLSPYDKGKSSVSYADLIFQQSKAERPFIATKGAVFYSQRRVTTSKPVCIIPQEVMLQSMRHYECNQLAALLQTHFGLNMTEKLLQQFQVGTSSHWPGACIFWYIDEMGRVRGGQIKLLGEDGHTVKYIDRKGVKRSKTNWVHAVLERQLKCSGKLLPDWLQKYQKNGQASPCLFGLPQLKTAPPDKPIAIVESPKTAIVATGYFPEFIWLATGAKDYLTAERLAPIKHRILSLWPDLDAYDDTTDKRGKSVSGWLSKAKNLEKQGFKIEVSNCLERLANDEQRKKGLDLADFMIAVPVSNYGQPVSSEKSIIVTTIAEWAANPGSTLRPELSQLTFL